MWRFFCPSLQHQALLPNSARARLIAQCPLCAKLASLADNAGSKLAISILIVGTDQSVILAFVKLSAHVQVVAPLGKSVCMVLSIPRFACHAPWLAVGAVGAAEAEEVLLPALKAEPAALFTWAKLPSTWDAHLA